MNDLSKERLKEILSKLKKLDTVHPDAVPDIDLYMDQVTTFMDRELAGSKRYPEDKLLTKTMINNYTKNELIPPPDKKKYSRDHLYLLTFIYYLKSFLSISDIRTILRPMIDRFYNAEDGSGLESIYRTVYEAEEKHSVDVAKDIMKRMLQSQNTFLDMPEGDDRDYLQLFSFIATLSFDVYVKKQIIEHLADLLAESESSDGKKKKG